MISNPRYDIMGLSERRTRNEKAIQGRSQGQESRLLLRKLKKKQRLTQSPRLFGAVENTESQR
jgi:hypothetical protein